VTEAHAMLIHADFTQRVVIRSDEMPWAPSPAPGVERRMLDRVGDEQARATSIVRYAPDSHFPQHLHPDGEEILVLDGVFSDENGDYPAGSYLRNPPGSFHSPFTVDGCVIFVKLRQFEHDDKARLAVNTHRATWHPGQVPGLSVLPLHSHGTVHTALVRWAPGTVFSPHRHWGGEEIFVLEGTFQDEQGAYPAHTWMRSPHLSAHAPFSQDGCLIYVKTGHLPGDQIEK
jgi:anti-sigma factor ChrR (cupin superfamily)